jgi:hypothetical protein
MGKSESTDLKRIDSDDAVLAALGYKQEFKREFTMLETFGLSFSYVGLVPSMAYVLFFGLKVLSSNTCHSSVIIYAIPNGGTVAMVWGVSCSPRLLVDVCR